LQFLLHALQTEAFAIANAIKTGSVELFQPEQGYVDPSTLTKQPSLSFGFATIFLAGRLMMRTPWPD